MSNTTRVITSPSTAGLDERYSLAGSHILCEALQREGVQLIYGYPGGTIMPFYDALWGWCASNKNSSMRAIILKCLSLAPTLYSWLLLMVSKPGA
jgi:hypothetical protein